MDADLSAQIGAILSDPGQMEKLTEMAKGLFGQMGGGSDPGETEAALPESVGAVPAGDARFISALGKAFAAGGGNSRSTALLVAMRPYMKPEKQQKLDRAMQIARMVHIAGAVMKQYGDGHGV